MKTPLSIIFKILVCFSVFVCVTERALAQGEKKEQAQHEDIEGSPLDSYGVIDSESVAAHLDNYAIQLQSSPNIKGYIFCYGPDGEVSGTGKLVAYITKNYLLNRRGFKAARVKFLYAGRYKDPADVFTELWMLP